MRLADERRLFERAQKSAAGFGELFDAYYDRLYAYCYRRVGARDIAEDLAANVFESALRGIQRVRWQGKPIIAWLYRIASRRIADFYRDRKDEVSLDEVVIRADDPIQDSMEREEDYAMVRRGIAKLAPRDREVLWLSYFDRLDGAEMAAILGCTPNVAYVRVHRALMKLRKALMDEA
jgi:RNA polymerase sigma-70 factor (ECF subfamily)